MQLQPRSFNIHVPSLHDPKDVTFVRSILFNFAHSSDLHISHLAYAFGGTLSAFSDGPTVGSVESPRETRSEVQWTYAFAIGREARGGLRLQRWLAFAKDLRVLANLHRDYEHFAVAHALLDHALAAAEKVAGYCEAGGALVQQIGKDQQEVFELMNGARLDLEEASPEKPEVLDQ